MGNYKRVVLKETEKDLATTQTGSDVQKQLSKFDTNYTSKKLNDLYNEFDSITFNNDLGSATIVKENASVATKSEVSFKVAVYLTTAILVTMLLAVLAIYNIFVINNLNSNIQLLQEDVAVAQTELDNVYGNLSKLTEEELKALIKGSLDGNYGDISDNGFIDVGMLETTNIPNYDTSTNWFDKFCSFLNNLFGG